MIDVASDIKARLNIHDIVAPFVQMQKAGRNFKALCPFHQEKTPSFIISPDKGMAYCFGCHRGGDIFKFTMEREGISFGEALKLLAEKAGVKLPREYKMPEKGKREKLIALHEAAAKFFQEKLWDTKEGESVQRYLLKKRKFKEKTIKDFGLGYAPDSEKELVNFLLHADFSKGEIQESGLSVSGIDSFRDKFRGRLMFPIWDSQGRVIAFGGRALAEGQEPKYLNSPETLLYSKSNVLYAYDRAKDSIKKENRALIVEGYMDALRAHECGFQNTAASCGTALTKQQVELAKRHTENIVLFFDSDEAGRQATLRSWPIASQSGMNVFVLRAKGVKDPDEWMIDDPDAVKKSLETPQSFFDFLIDDVQKRFDLKNIHEKKSALSEILPLLSQIGSKFELDQYLQNLARLFKTTPQSLYDEIYRLGRTPQEIRKTLDQKTSKLKVSEYIIGCLLEFPFSYRAAAETGLTEENFDDIEKSLYKIVGDVYNNQALEGEDAEITPIAEEMLPEETREKAKMWSLFASSQNHMLSRADLMQEIMLSSRKFLEQKREERKRELHYKLKEAEENGDADKKEALIEEMQRLLVTN